MKRCLAMISFFAALCVFGFAQESAKILTVDDAVQLALQNNITIKQSKLDLDLLAKKDKYSWNSASPSLSLSGGFNGKNSLPSKETEPDLSYSLGASVSISLTPALATSIKAAKLAYESGEASLENTKRSIKLSVCKTFYSLIYFNENLELQERSLDMAKQTYEANQIKYKQGRLSELNLLQSQVNYESKIPSVENLKASYQSSIDNFKLILGLPLSDEIELSGSLDDYDDLLVDETILQKSIDEIPSIKTLKQSIASAENSLTATKFSAFGPSVSFNLNYNGAGVLKENVDASPSSSLSYGVSLRVPLDGYLPWSNGALSVASQKENIEKLKLNLEQTKISTELSLKNSYNSILQAQEQLKLYEKNVELMQKTYDMTKNAYNVGSSDLMTLQNAETNLYQAKYNVQNQRYNIISAILDLKNTLGE